MLIIDHQQHRALLLGIEAVFDLLGCAQHRARLDLGFLPLAFGHRVGDDAAAACA